MLKVDLELAPEELVVARHHFQAVSVQVAHPATKHVIGITSAPRDVDVARGVAVPPPAVRRLLVALEDEELQLGPGDRPHVECRETLENDLEDVARAQL